jgi:hypothetical protein
MANGMEKMNGKKKDLIEKNTKKKNPGEKLCTSVF